MIVMHIKLVHSKSKSIDSSAQEITYATTSYNNIELCIIVLTFGYKHTTVCAHQSHFHNFQAKLRKKQ